MNRITFEVNNGMTMDLTQFEPGERVFLRTIQPNGNHYGKTLAITPETFVMLMEYIKYIKWNDIRHDFINPHGTKEA